MTDNTLGSVPFEATPQKRERKAAWPICSSRLHPREYDGLETAARKLGLKKSEYIRSRLVQAVLADLAA